MLILNTSDTMQYGFMLSRVYLQLNINHEDVMSMLQEYRDIPGIGDQVDYLMNACQIQMDESRVGEIEPEVKRRRGVMAIFPHGEVRLRVGQVCRHRKYNYVCLIYGWDTHCKASKVRRDDIITLFLLSFTELDIPDGSGQTEQQRQTTFLQRPGL